MENNSENKIEKTAEERVKDYEDKLQLFLHTNLQVLISKCVDAGYDIFTVLTFLKEIVKIYENGSKEEFKKMCKNRKKWEEDNKISEKLERRSMPVDPNNDPMVAQMGGGMGAPSMGGGMDMGMGGMMAPPPQPGMDMGGAGAGMPQPGMPMESYVIKKSRKKT